MKIWVDLSNSPHVLFFRPIIAELEARGHQPLITVRDFAQTVALADRYGLDYTVIDGWTTKKSVWDKGLRAARRTWDLVRFIRGRGVDLALSHGSHIQAMAAFCLRIPVIIIMDYEYQPANRVSFRLAKKVFTPAVAAEAIVAGCGIPPEQVEPYQGIKEEIYLSDFVAIPGFLESLGIPSDRVIVCVRPPGTGIYHHFENALFRELMAYLNGREDLFIILLPRFPKQGQAIRSTMLPRAWIPPQVVDGPNLIYHSDLVISAGGTMNREAAVLGTPAYTVFAGEIGAVDLHLINQGKIVHIERPENFAEIRLEKKQAVPLSFNGHLAQKLTDRIMYYGKLWSNGHHPAQDGALKKGPDRFPH